jgi:hypothetical protein
MNDQVGSMRHGGVVRIELTVVEERGHGGRAGCMRQGGYVAFEGGAGGQQDICRLVAGWLLVQGKGKTIGELDEHL